MDFFNLFSHLQKPELVPSGDTSTAAVEHPIFSDRPEANTPGATTSSP